MTSASATTTGSPSTLSAKRVFLAAGICLLAGLVFGFLLRNLQQPASSSTTGQRPVARQSTRRVPSLAEMHQMADKQAAPLLEKLKSDPHNGALLAKVGSIYHAAHQYNQAVTYFDKAVTADPGNANLRTKLAISLYRSGDTDGAIMQLHRALKRSPKDADALFNLGFIELRGKQDGHAAVKAWQRLLNTNPHLSPQRKAEVQQLMAQVMNELGK